MNGSLFAMFLYLVLYLQDILGYSALDTGLRLLVSTGGTFVAAAISGRLSEHVPVRYLIAPGLGLVGIGLLLMSGISGTSSWTHLLPGFIVAGTGAGLVNPPLASTAIGVVTPERSGMASGVNSTFRQIGFAVSIAALGSIFASSLRNDLQPCALESTGACVTRPRGDRPDPPGQCRQGDRLCTSGAARSAGRRYPVQLRERHRRPHGRHGRRRFRRRGRVAAAHPPEGLPRPSPASGDDGRGAASHKHLVQRAGSTSSRSR